MKNTVGKGMMHISGHSYYVSTADLTREMVDWMRWIGSEGDEHGESCLTTH